MVKYAYLIIGVLLIGVITFLSLKESISFTSSFFSFTDKIFHLGAYVVLTFFWSRYLMLQAPSYSLKRVLITVCTCLFIYGIIIEVLQTELTRNRVGEWEDVVANVSGIIIGAIASRYISKLEVKL